MEDRLGRSLQWSAWAHRDTDHPHAHVVIRASGERDKKHLEREIRSAADDAYSEIRERQREYAKEREQNRGPDLEP